MTRGKLQLNSPLCFAGVLVDAILDIRLRKCGEAMPFAPPAVLLALNVEFGVVQERVGEPSMYEGDKSGALCFGVDCLLSRKPTITDSDEKSSLSRSNSNPFIYHNFHNEGH